jgi:hypothetical protein
VATDRELGAGDVGRIRKRGLDVPVAHLELGRALGRPQIEHRRELLVPDRDEFRRVLGRVWILGEHDGDRLADVAHPFPRQDRLPVRVERLVGDLDPDGDPIDFGEVRRREDRVHAFGRARNARVHLAQVRVRDLRTDHAEPQLTGEVDVVDEATVAYQQAGVLDPEQRPGARHGCVAGSATASAARRTARRMFW